MLVVNSEKSIERITELLKNMGITVKDSDGNYRGVDAVLNDLSYAWHELDEHNKMNVFAYILKMFPAYIEKSASEIGKSIKSVISKL